MTRTLIKYGKVIDGTGKAAFLADVLVENNLITAIGDFKDAEADTIIDAQDLMVVPGFIDTHSHSDVKILLEPLVEPKVRQGITTEVLGQDGISTAPLPVQYISPWRKNLAGLDGDSDEIDWSFRNTAGYLSRLEQTGIGINESYLIPHGNVRMEAIGLDNRQPNLDELKLMQAIVRREMEAGGRGLSTGLIYMPCAYAQTSELIELCKVVASYDGVFVIHQRSEADDILNSMQEVIQIGRESGVKIHFSHMKVCGKKNWPEIDQVLSLLEQAAAEGVRVSFDQYPYVAGSTMLGVILPPWVHDGGTDRLLTRLSDRGLRQKMIYDIEHGIPGWDNFVDFAGLDQIYVTSVKTEANQDLVGKSLLEIGEIRHRDPYNAAFDLLFEEENAVGMVDFYGTEEHVIRFLKRREQNVCTDGLLGGKPHPRVYGSYPRILGRYVREQKALSWEEAVHKMTGKPADVFGFSDRGRIAAGLKADLTIFDPNTVIDKGDFIEPAQFPAGIEYVLVNGKVVVTPAGHTGIKAGRVLKK